MIQDYVSRYDTVRMKLSELSWSKGIANYFYQSVPWQYTTSQYLAQKVCTIISQLPEKGPIHLLELGAGCGLLTKHILDQLRSFHAPIFDRVKVMITDSSKHQIDHIKSGNFLAEYRDKLMVQELSAMTIDYGFEPTLIYFSNLIDATPTIHVEVQDGMAYERVIQTIIPDWVMERFAVTSLDALLKHPDAYIFGQSLVGLLEETHTLVRLPETVGKEIQAYVEQYDCPNGALFNVQLPMIHVFRSWIKQFPQATIFATDFGNGAMDPCIQDSTNLLSRYGICSFSSVQFEVFRSLLNHPQIHITANEPGSMQTMIVSPYDYSHVLSNCSMAAYTASIPDMSWLNDTVSVDKIMSNQSAFQPYFYSITKVVVSLVSHQSFDHAIQVIYEVSKRFGPMSLPLLVLLGWIYIQKGDRQLALQTFQYVISLTPYVPEAYKGLIHIFNALDQKDRVSMYSTMLDQLTMTLSEE